MQRQIKRTIALSDTGMQCQGNNLNFCYRCEYNETLTSTDIQILGIL